MSKRRSWISISHGSSMPTTTWTVSLSDAKAPRDSESREGRPPRCRGRPIRSVEQLAVARTLGSVEDRRALQDDLHHLGVELPDARALEVDEEPAERTPLLAPQERDQRMADIAEADDGGGRRGRPEVRKAPERRAPVGVEQSASKPCRTNEQRAGRKTLAQVLGRADARQRFRDPGGQGGELFGLGAASDDIDGLDDPARRLEGLPAHDAPPADTSPPSRRPEPFFRGPSRRTSAASRATFDSSRRTRSRATLTRSARRSRRRRRERTRNPT